MKPAAPSRPWTTAFAVASTLLGALPSTDAQEPPRRAEIVDESPAPSAPPVAPRAAPRADVVPEDAAPEAAPKTTPEVRPAQPRAKTPEDDLFDFSELHFAKGSYALAIRQYEEYLKIFPNGKYLEEARFKIGESHYLNKAWELAVMEYDSYLKDFPQGTNRAKVLYHAGESHRLLAARLPTKEEQTARMAIAEDAYRATLQATKTGPYAAYAAFRLGSFAYNAAVTDPGRYKDAVRWFTVAAAQMPKEQTTYRFQALFLKAKSLKFSGAVKEAALAFEEVTRVKPGNEFYEKALMEQATLDMEAGRQDAAMKKFEILAKEGQAAEMRAESMVNAGMIHARAGRPEEAIKHFEDAARVPNAPLAQASARYGLVFSYFKQKSYDKVISAWRGIGDYSALDAGARAQLLLIVGTSYASIDQHLRAAEIFGILEENIPGSEEALEAGYKRLVSLFKMNDPALPEAATEYVERSRTSKPDSDFLDKAWLVRAAYYYNRSVWEQSAEAYQRVRDEKLEPEKLATFLYQRGSAETFAGNKEAVTTLSKFIEKYPEDERIPMALLNRGKANIKIADYAGASRDFETIREKYPKSEGAESAAYHAGFVKRLKEDYPGMVTEFQRLLKDYPGTKVAPEAWYWIGTGLFQQQKYKEAVEPLRTAREKDTKAYYTDASLMIIGALTAQKEIDALMLEVDGYLKGTQEKKISPEILSWLGRTVFQDRQDYRAASRYLSPIVDYSDPRATSPEIWAALGESQVENGSFESGIVALDHQLATEERPAARVKSYLLKGRAYLALGKSEEATKSAESGLDLDKETLTCAWLRILLGDIAMASSRFNEAISSYGLVILNWEDATVTPLAMTKLIAAYEKSGDAANKGKAEGIKKDLEKRFPRFQQIKTP